MSASLQALQSSLETELALVQRFLGILKAEAEALEQPDHSEALNSSTRDKNACIEQLLEAGRSRDDALRELGLDTGRAGLDEAAAAHPLLHDTCARLFELSQHASQLNAANGAMISTYLKHTQQALHALQPLVGNPGLYDASGRPGQAKGQRKAITAG
ncbi:flagella synthesis protein FlgN [Pusillimonas noertemannii]|uniref:flagella synthesis protein FlgN n=1 Tax=Pusillimonas noertemannii TaxID=305977 RepID=UPI003341F8DB